jgi:hypothetical protein
MIPADFLTNVWVNNMASNYSEAILLIPAVLMALIKFLAILDPKVPASDLIGWVQSTFYKAPVTGTAGTVTKITTVEGTETETTNVVATEQGAVENTLKK